MQLVNDNKPQIREFDLVIKYSMSTDNEVQLSLGKTGNYISFLRCRSGRRQQCYFKLVSKQRKRILVMLSCKYLGRRHYRRLSAAFFCIKTRQERYHCLARPDVAHKHPIGMPLSAQVVYYLVDCLILRRRKLIRQSGDIFTNIINSAFIPKSL